MSLFPTGPLNPKKIFEHAGKFQWALEILMDPGHITRKQAEGVADPSLILSAIASELYLKCLLVDLNVPEKQFKKVHNLYDLFTKLNPQVQNRITVLFDQEIWSQHKREFVDYVQTNFGKGQRIPRHFSQLLKMGANTFVDLRYIYEKNPRKIDNLISDLPAILRRVIIELHPDWKP